jgi:hypothetical protein
MRKKSKLIAIAALFCLMTAFLLTACAVGPQSLDEMLTDRGFESNGQTAVVTYYSQEGTFDGTGNKHEKNMYYQAGAPILNIGMVENRNASVAYSGYVFMGWYYAETTTAEDGTVSPVVESTDADGNILTVKSSETAVEFPLTVQNGQHLYLCASWKEDVRLEYKLIGPSVTVQGSDGQVTTYQAGDIIYRQSFETFSSIYLTEGVAPTMGGATVTDATFLQYYSDAEGTQPFSGNVYRNEEENPVIYVEYVTGTWDIVRSTSDVVSMFMGLNSSAGRYYLAKDIDMTGVTVTSTATRLGATVKGNGKTISNLTFSFGESRALSSGDHSIFGQITANANVSDLTLSNVTLKYRVGGSSTVGLYAVATGGNEGATFSNFKIDGLKMEVTVVSGSTVSITNMATGNGYKNDHILYGAEESDAAFIEKYPVPVVENVTLSVDGTSVS